MGQVNVLRDAFAFLMGPSLVAILIATLVALGLPLVLHLYLHHFQSSRAHGSPTFLLIGPSGSGKTSLLTQWARGKHVDTHTSQAPLTVEATLPTAVVAASAQFRANDDPNRLAPQRLTLIDTPGHGKLRYHAMDSVKENQTLRGIIFVVDAAAMSSTSSESTEEGIRDAAEYLHDVLLLLQKRAAQSKSSKIQEMPVLVAANKIDLFTALPAPLVRTVLEEQITKVRASRAKGLLDSGVGVDDPADALDDDDQDRLGGASTGKFEFRQMEEAQVSVEVLSGSVVDADGPQVEAWWAWVASHI
ncbi:MAG: hypothetical protein M1838_003063 [Thelocarpon superellum]|nr:MAG: hypothetical protein M1838_003063 [Thelocarpon superellum]